MRLINEGIDDNPVFIRRKIGENRESINLTRLNSVLKKFLNDSRPLSSEELDDVSELLQRGLVDVQKKRRHVLLKKIKKLKQYEDNQKKEAEKLGVPKRNRKRKRR